MKILIFNTLYYPYRIGGAEKSVQLLAEGLVGKGYSVTVATLHEKKHIIEDVINGVKIVRFPLRNLYWLDNHNHSFIKKMIWHLSDIFNVKMYKMIKESFLEDNYDVIHTNNLSGFSVAVWHWAKKKKIPVCHTARDYYLLHPNGTLFKNGKNISTKSLSALPFSFIKKIISSNVKSFVSISKYVEKIHKGNGFFPNAKSYVVYNSNNSVDYVPDFKNKEKITLGFLGRVEEVKGIEFFLNAVSKSKCKEFTIVIAGKGDAKYLSELSKKYANLEIVFKGTVDIQDFFPEIDYLVVPSLWHEPMGRVVIEANSYSVPVIGSNRGGIKEIVKNNETGFIFDVDNIDSLIYIFENLYTPKSKEYLYICENALRYSENFNSENLVNLYSTIYHSSIIN